MKKSGFRTIVGIVAGIFVITAVLAFSHPVWGKDTKTNAYFKQVKSCLQSMVKAKDISRSEAAAMMSALKRKGRLDGKSGKNKESGQKGGELDRGEGEEESGTEYTLNQTCDQVRNGARLILKYNPRYNAFVGAVVNTTAKPLKKVRVEVHLSNGKELGPTTPVNLKPGEKSAVKLTAVGKKFDRWTAHPEVGEEEHKYEGKRTDGRGEHSRNSVERKRKAQGERERDGVEKEREGSEEHTRNSVERKRKGQGERERDGVEKEREGSGEHARNSVERKRKGQGERERDGVEKEREGSGEHTRNSVERKRKGQGERERDGVEKEREGSGEHTRNSVERKRKGQGERERDGVEKSRKYRSERDHESGEHGERYDGRHKKVWEELQKFSDRGKIREEDLETMMAAFSNKNAPKKNASKKNTSKKNASKKKTSKKKTSKKDTSEKK